jgi:hypothetical protein
MRQSSEVASPISRDILAIATKALKPNRDHRFLNGAETALALRTLKARRTKRIVWIGLGTGVGIALLLLFLLPQSNPDPARPRERDTVTPKDLVNTPFVVTPFLVDEQTVTIDLRKWKPVPKGKENEMISKEMTSTSLKLRRLDPQVKNYTYMISTDAALEPAVAYSPADHFRIERFPDGDKGSAAAWKLVIDVSPFKLNEPFDLKYDSVFWNTFQSVNEWTAIHALHPTKILTLEIYFPDSKPVKTYDLYIYNRTTGSKEPFVEERIISLSVDAKHLIWRINDPTPNRGFRLDWEW